MRGRVAAAVIERIQALAGRGQESADDGDADVRVRVFCTSSSSTLSVRKHMSNFHGDCLPQTLGWVDCAVRVRVEGVDQHDGSGCILARLVDGLGDQRDRAVGG